MNDLWLKMLAQGPYPSPGESGEQTTTGTKIAAPGDETSPVPRKPSITDYLPLIVGMFLVFYFFVIRPPKKRQKQQQQMMDALKKNTRIRTIGGIIATVVEVRDDEVVIKIDETTNAKMRIARSAIGKVLTEEELQK